MITYSLIFIICYNKYKNNNSASNKVQSEQAYNNYFDKIIKKNVGYIYTFGIENIKIL